MSVVDALGKHTTTVIVILLIMVPIGTIYYEFQSNTPVQDQGKIIMYDYHLNNNTNLGIEPVGDLPAFSTVSVFVNISQVISQGNFSLTVVEESQYQAILNGTYPRKLMNRLTVSQQSYFNWYNVTTTSDGVVYLFFQLENTTRPVDVNDIYTYKTMSYPRRNILPIAIYGLMYLILVFGIFPRIIHRMLINHMKRKKQEERMKEEQEFYKNLERNA